MRAADRRDRVRGGRRPAAQGQVGARAGVARAAGGRRARRPEPQPDASRRRSSAATTSCGCSRTCSTRRAASGRARLVSVIGPAGIGKSRLAWEFAKYLDGLVETVWWHHGRSPAYGDGISVLGARRDGPAPGRAARERRRGDDPGEGRATTVAKLVPDPDERRWIEPALLALLGIEARVAVRRAVRRVAHLLRAARRDGPVVLVFEDLHWADTGLLDFVDHLLEWSRNAPIYVLTLARPELLERAPRLGCRQAQLHLDVPRAARRAGDARAARRAGAGPPRRAVVRPSWRVPTASRCTPSRRSGCSSRRAGSGSRATTYGPIGDLAHARRARDADRAHRGAPRRASTPQDRALVSDAAVLGQSFTLAALAAVSRRPGSELEPRLRDPRPPRAPRAGGRPTLAGTRPVRVRAGADPGGRLQHARPRGPQGPSPRRGALLRGAGDRGAGRRACRPLPRRPRQRARGARGGRARGPGAHRAPCRGRAGLVTRRARPGDRVLRAGAVDHARGDRPGGVARCGRQGRDRGRARRRRRPSLPGGARPPSSRRRSAGPGRDGGEPCRGAPHVVSHRTRARTAGRCLEPVRRPGRPPAFVRLQGQLARAYFFNDEDARAVAKSDSVLEAAERLELVQIVADT